MRRTNISSIGGGSCKGVSLVELLIALVIGLVIILGAGQLFLMGLQSYNRMEALAQRQDSLRYVVDVLSDDVRSAFNPLSQNPNQNDTAVAVASDGKSISLEFYDDKVSLRGREGIPYCSDVNGDGDIDDLYYLNYDFSGGDLKVSYRCGYIDGASPTIGAFSTAEAVVSGVDDITFSRVGFATIGVELSFPPLGGDDGGEVFYFIITNRIKALSKVNTLLNNF